MMKFDFGAVDEHTATLNTIIHAMETNLSNMQALKTELLNEFQGAGAQGYSDVSKNLENKLNEYNDAIQKVRIAIGEVAGSQGQMSATDKANANRFLSIHG